MPYPWLPPRGKSEKKAVFSSHCGDETNINDNGAFLFITVNLNRAIKIVPLPRGKHPLRGSVDVPRRNPSRTGKPSPAGALCRAGDTPSPPHIFEANVRLRPSWPRTRHLSLYFDSALRQSRAVPTAAALPPPLHSGPVPAAGRTNTAAPYRAQCPRRDPEANRVHEPVRGASSCEPTSACRH